MKMSKITIVIELDSKYADRFVKDAEGIMSDFINSMCENVYVKFNTMEVKRWEDHIRENPFKLELTAEQFKRLWKTYQEELE